MRLSGPLHAFTRKLLLFLVAICIIAIAGYFIWQKSKFSIIKHRIANIFLEKTDSLYTIRYDSLYFDEHEGNAYLTNIHIIPDTVRIKNQGENIPYMVVDVTIHSLNIKGINSALALKGEQIVGDSIIVDAPHIQAYILRKVKKNTKIDVEAKKIYHEIFNRLKLIQVSDVRISHADIIAANFSNREKEFELDDANIGLHNVRIDSFHRDDTSRLLFCKEGTFSAIKFSTFNHNREELSIHDPGYKNRRLTISRLEFNHFEDSSKIGVAMIIAENMILSGIDNYQVIKNKIFAIDSIFCRHIQYYQPSSFSLTSPPLVGTIIREDTSGFRAAYAAQVKTIYFPDIDLHSQAHLSKHTVGKFTVKAHGINAEQLLMMQFHPLDHIKQLDVQCAGLSWVSKDNLYTNKIAGITFHSPGNQLFIESFNVIPRFSEEGFAAKASYQRDRYIIDIRKIVCNNLDPKALVGQEIDASSISSNYGSLKIYRDISKPLEDISKVGNYPQQILLKSNFPINVRKIDLTNFYIEYKEKNALTGKAGTIGFDKSHIALSNITNKPTLIRTDNLAHASLDTRVLGMVPMKIDFTFNLADKQGKFDVSGYIDSFDLRSVNEISRTMALIEIEAGKMNSVEFKFSGNDYSAGGNLTMKYNGLKVALLKKDDDGQLTKKSLISLFANVLLKNDNPHNGKLRNFDIHYERDIHKSFFNLVWKTLFTGMKETVGMPASKTQ